MKEVAQRCWACWVAQRASKRPNKLKGGILDSSMVCSLIPDLWGDGAKRREKRKKLCCKLARTRVLQSALRRSQKVTKKGFQKKVGGIIWKVGAPMGVKAKWHFKVLKLFWWSVDHSADAHFLIWGVGPQKVTILIVVLARRLRKKMMSPP